ncbi:MAG: hypothetical protein HPY75_05860 [Actinobacteria bacterium]|nr:hypothetical protein [Actinomycetota bacterium]
MQIATDLLKVLFFPGLLFMASCGLVVLFAERGLARALGGGEEQTKSPLAGLTALPPSPSLGDAIAALLPAAAMGVAGVFLVWVEGDLLSLALMISVTGLIPLAWIACSDAESTARVPLFFREAFARLLALACAAVAVSLRYPGGFAPELEGFNAQGALDAVRAWSGPGFALILSSQACAVVALFVFLLGRPPYGSVARRRGSEVVITAPAAVAEWAERAVTVLLLALVCLGYPWKGAVGALSWGASCLGIATAATAGRAWLEVRDAVLRRRVLLVAPLLGMVSLALALAAAAYGG